MGTRQQKCGTRATGKELLTLSNHSSEVSSTNEISSVAWNPDGKRLAIGSWDKTAMVWDTDTGKSLLTLSGHSDFVDSVAWSPDGKRLATASRDKTVQVYAIDIQDLMNLARERVTAHPASENCQKYLHSACPPFPKLVWW